MWLPSWMPLWFALLPCFIWNMTCEGDARKWDRAASRPPAPEDSLSCQASATSAMSLWGAPGLANRWRWPRIGQLPGGFGGSFLHRHGHWNHTIKWTGSDHRLFQLWSKLSQWRNGRCAPRESVVTNVREDCCLCASIVKSQSLSKRFLMLRVRSQPLGACNQRLLKGSHADCTLCRRPDLNYESSMNSVEYIFVNC